MELYLHSIGVWKTWYFWEVSWWRQEFQFIEMNYLGTSGLPLAMVCIAERWMFWFTMRIWRKQSAMFFYKLSNERQNSLLLAAICTASKITWYFTGTMEHAALGGSKRSSPKPIDASCFLIISATLLASIEWGNGRRQIKGSHAFEWEGWKGWGEERPGVVTFRCFWGTCSGWSWSTESSC